MKDNKRKESDRKQVVIPVADEKRNSLLQNDRSNSLSNGSSRYNPLDNRIHQNGNNRNPVSNESFVCLDTCCGKKPKYLICILVTAFSVILAITAVIIILSLFVFNKKGVDKSAELLRTIHDLENNNTILLKYKQEASAALSEAKTLADEEAKDRQYKWWYTLPKDCFQLCQPEYIHEGIRERYAIKQWVSEERNALGTDGSHCPLGIIGKNGTEKTFTLFAYPTEEPKYDPSEVGEELMLTPLIQAGRYEEVKTLSKVNAAALGIDIVSYSGFLTIQNSWFLQNNSTQLVDSNLFFWFFPAKPDSNEYNIEGWYNTT